MWLINYDKKKKMSCSVNKVNLEVMFLLLQGCKFLILVSLRVKTPSCLAVKVSFRVAFHAGVFRGARFSSLPTNACSTEDNIPFPSLANHIVLSKFWKVDLDRKVI